MKLKQTILVLASMLSGVAMAHDLGVHSKVYPIEEVDARQLLMESAARVNWDAVNKQRVDQAKSWSDNLPVRANLTWPESTKVKWVDPSAELTEDITVPWKNPATNQMETKILFPKGTKFNPLSKFRPNQAMFLFDSRDEAQEAMAFELLKKKPYTVMLVATAGNPQKLSEKAGRPVYYAFDYLLDKFAIDSVPSLVFTGEGSRALYLGVLSPKKGVKVDTLIKHWETYTNANLKK